MSRIYILEDADHPATRPLSRFRSIFSQRTGMLTPLERLQIREPGCQIYLKHPVPEVETAVAAMAGLRAFGEGVPDGAETRDSHDLLPWLLLENVGASIQADIALLGNTNLLQEFLQGKSALRNAKFQLEGPAENLFIHREAKILPGVVIDASDGPVVLGKGSRIAPSSYLAGPLYIGGGAQVDNAHISGGCIIGRQVRAGGEIGNALINDFSNKHHEGFLGHSVLGSWVNLGALTTTSDLKNNYGEIRLTAPEAYYAGPTPTISELETGRIKFGSIIGDMVKIAIGTMLNTGTIIDAGSNVFGGPPPKYSAPLSWGIAGEIYDPERFIKDCIKIFARRGESPEPELSALVKKLS